MTFSTGLKNKILDSTGLAASLTLGKIKIYTGAEPASPDAPATGTLLATITNNNTATGLTFAAASGGTISKTVSEVWSGAAVATGQAGYFRFVATGDDNTQSSSQARIQGSCGLAGSDLILSYLNFVTGSIQTIESFVLGTNTSN